MVAHCPGVHPLNWLGTFFPQLLTSKQNLLSVRPQRNCVAGAEEKDDEEAEEAEAEADGKADEEIGKRQHP